MSDKTSAIPPSPSAADYAAEADRPLIPDVAEPFGLLETWLTEARASEPNDSSAMSLATVDADGMPDVRIVLLRGVSPEGLKFYTNYDSTKAEQLLASGKAALCLHWKSLRRQIRVRGSITRASAAASDAYFARRTPQSRISAIASDQSQPLPDRAIFEQRVAQLSAQYGDSEDIPRPKNWGGFNLVPDEVEFWQSQAFRMHDRLRLTRDGAGWASTRLYP